MKAVYVSFALAACTGVKVDPGLEAQVRVASAQFYAGPMPAPTTQLQVTAIDSSNNTIWPGQVNKALSGRLDGDGRAVAIAFANDSGYWIVPAGAADLNMPDELTWAAKVSFSDELDVGTHELDVAAVDASGAFGAPSTLDLTVKSRMLDVSSTRLAFALKWDTEADLDLHVVVPGDPPVIVWSGHPSSYAPAPGDPPDPAAVAAAGQLDVDSNGQCVIDGRREENVAWMVPDGVPPHGTYAVLVDTFSLCAATTAHWNVDVFAGGAMTSRAHAEGTVTDGELRGDHTATSGTQALVFSF